MLLVGCQNIGGKIFMPIQMHMGGFHSRIDTKDIGKVINGVCYLLERNDNHAIILFSEYDDQKIEKLQLEIQKKFKRKK